jgi:hypothetical protein
VRRTKLVLLPKQEPAVVQTEVLETHQFCKHDIIKSFTRFTLQPKSATETECVGILKKIK